MIKRTGSGGSSFATLDGLRGLGAILVVMGHSLHFWPGVQFPTGTVVVDMFFLLSGFVIAYAFEPRLSAGTESVASFTVSRLIRFYPLYILGTLIAFAVIYVALQDNGDAGAKWAIWQLVPQLVMIPSPPQLQTPDIYAFNNPAWTLFFEFIVNMVYVLAFRLLLNTRILIVLVLVCAVALAVTDFTWPGGNPGHRWDSALGGLARASFGFFAGVLAFRLVGSPRKADRPRSWASVLIVATLPIYALVPTVAETQAITEFAIAVVLGLPLILVAQAVQPPRMLEKLFQTLGRISYALYIIHYGVVLAAIRLDWRVGMPDGIKPLAGVALIVICVLLAYVAERYYDRPLRKLMTNATRSRKKRERTAKAPAE
jgi:peptidoglycan/LPS O-acetylase OafA/YrhL